VNGTWCMVYGLWFMVYGWVNARLQRMQGINSVAFFELGMRCIVIFYHEVRTNIRVPPFSLPTPAIPPSRIPPASLSFRWPTCRCPVCVI
jgi:hypothetical protein